MLKRPTPYDDEEEILKQQEEFFKQKAQNKIKTAARVESRNQGNSETIKDEKINSEEQNASEINIQEQIANTFEAIPTNMKLNHIIENQLPDKIKTDFKFNSHGFPKAARRDPNIKPKKGSIFSQNIKRLKKEVETAEDLRKMDVDENKVIKGQDEISDREHTKISASAFSISRVQSSTILTNIDKKAIHEENLNKLKTMTHNELMSEREKLVSTLDPILVQFIRSRKLKNIEESENRNPSIEEQNTTTSVSLEELDAPKEMLSRPEANEWLHFNKFEANKLAWMKDITVQDLRKTTGFEARFDFEGYLLPYNVEQIDESNRHLYHHGDEPDRPGYNLREILLLTRSTVIQQKVVALNTLANILSLDQTGIYDKVIDIPFEQVFFVIRVCLDDNTPSVLNASIKALRNLIYFQIDETCVDNMLHFGIGLTQPILAVDHTTEDDNTVNDQQLAETNLIKCLSRTDILVRIRYIINTVKPSLETIVYCVEILIRMARDSDFIINRMLQCEGLFQSLIKYFLPTLSLKTNSENPVYYMPLTQVIKLLRILSSRNRTIAERILYKYNTLETIIHYLYDEYFSQNASGLHLQIECLHYWIVVLHYGLATESIKSHENLLLKFMDYHYKNTNNDQSTTLVRQSHVSALLLLISKCAEKEIYLFPSLISDSFNKWIKQFETVQYFKCGHSQISSSVLYCAATYNRCSGPVYKLAVLEQFINSECFNAATRNILNSSLLLNNYETHKTTANLKTLEAAAWYTMDHIVPVMQTNSCMPFLLAMSICILSDNSYQMKITFLKHPNIKEYLQKLNSTKYYFNVGNWFTRCESFLIMNILKIAEQVRDHIDPDIYYTVAVKCLCVFSAEQKKDMQFLLENIIFCPRFYPVEMAIENTSISKRNSELNEAWRHLSDIKQVYADVLGLTKNRITFETTLSLDASIGNVIPMDWIYTPLVVLYANQQKRPKDASIDEQADFYIILNCLRWILIYETYFESLAESISPTEKYVRLGCLFLGSDTLFLNDNIQRYLVKIYGFLTKKENALHFEQEISGLPNFKDFFIQLLEQYQGVSYGNKVFGNVLLFPLVKRHDVKYRKTLWSEYMGVVETFTVTKEELWINYNDLIYPEDTDSSLCMCYFKALRSGSIHKGTVLYQLAEINAIHFKEKIAKQESKTSSSDINLVDMET